jgi:hypothetical protein
MDSTIEVAFTKKYSPMLYILTQQKGSKFASKVRRETVTGAKEAYFDRLGLADGEEITTRHPDTPTNEIPNSRRKVTLTSVHCNTPLDNLDKLQMMIDPQNAYTVAQANYLGRVQDDRIVAAALGSAWCGEDGTTEVAFKDDSISINGAGTATTLGTLAVTGAADMSLAKILLMLQIFNQEDVDEDIPKYWAVTPKDVSDMLDLEEIGSSDYNTIKAIQAGRMNPYCGFNFFWSNRITKDAAAGTAYRTFAWAQDGIIFATWEDVYNRVSERGDKSYMLQVYSRMTNGALRIDGAKVHECLNQVA